MSGTGAEITPQPGAEAGQNTPPPGAAAGAETKPFDLEALPDEAKKMIKDLRDESAKHRTKAKSLEDKLGTMDGTLNKLKTALGITDGVDPAEKLKQVQAEKEALEAEIAISQIVRGNDIPKESEKYFRFLLSEKFGSLGEGEELPEADLAAVIAEAKKFGPARSGASSTGIGQAGQPFPTNSASSVTPEAFAKMTTLEKSAIYSKDPAQYQALFSAAMDKKLI